MTDERSQTEQIESTIREERLMASLATVFAMLASSHAWHIWRDRLCGGASNKRDRHPDGAGRNGWTNYLECLAGNAATLSVGLALGIPAVLILSPILNGWLAAPDMQSVFYQLKPNDPPRIAATVVVLAEAAFSASYLPARHAAPVDPMIALRHD